MTKGFVLFQADRLGAENNCRYPNQFTVTDAATLSQVCQRDYVCASYRNNYRGKENFLWADCIPMDVDNDHSENPKDWLTPQDILLLFPDVTVGIHYSRHHMKAKGDRSPRPRFHVLFLCDKTDNTLAYSTLKQRLFRALPRFDKSALDSARLLYGTESPVCEFYPGTISINECLDMYYPEEDFDSDMPDRHAVIPQGKRNATMSLFAAKVLKRLGPTEQAERTFYERAEACEPPLAEDELSTIWKSALSFYERISKQDGYVPPEKYREQTLITPVPEDSPWDEPLVLDDANLPDFPMDALSPALRNYAGAVATSTQTSPDMAAVGILCAVSAAMRNLYVVEGKADWHEPTNIYGLVIAEPSERKSAVVKLITKPIDEYVRAYNAQHKYEFEMSQAQKTRLENRKNALISAARKKGQTAPEDDFDDDLQEVVRQLVEFDEIRPMRVYVDDTTPEKLVETLHENKGAISIISSEGGIFDVISGAYSSKVNIDVFLKAYSGEHIAVDRIMRNSIVVDDACLTILLTVQPVVIGDMMKNSKFRHRGLTARFLYTHPKSLVGGRDFHSETISQADYDGYKAIISNILSEERGAEPKVIRLTEQAAASLRDFYDWTEKRLVDEYSEYNDWIGKLVGNTLRIAGILARSSVLLKNVGDAILEKDDDIVITEDILRNAIRISKYFFSHAVHAYSTMGVFSRFRSVQRVVEKIREKDLRILTRRDLMRNCRWLASTEEAQETMDALEDYGFIRIVSIDTADKLRGGRPRNANYAVNPRVFGDADPSKRVLSH